MAQQGSHALSSRTRLLATLIAGCFAGSALALPTGAQIAAGTAAITQAGNVLTVNNSANAILNWQQFNIAASEAVRFNQPSASSSVLNRVLGADPSSLLGQLSSNGRVWLVNPAGILVGPGARIDTAGFVASTLNLRNEDFLAGKLTFGGNAGAGGIVNQGAIATPGGGSVYLVAPNVSNEGLITTPGGETILAAGQTVQLLDTATPGVKVEVTGSTGNVTNLGSVVAAAGRVGMAGVLVRNSGTLNASSVVSAGGRIFLKASGDTYVDQDAQLAATGSQGGDIEVLGQRVAVMDRAVLDASGQSGGGSVRVGGDYQGKNPEIQNADVTYFGPQATLRADATGKGDGGKVIVWADDTTRAYGNISARGGVSGGDGGFVETSGHYLDSSGIRVDTGASHGVAGTWLLDPDNLTITNAASATLNGDGNSGTPFAPQTGGGNLDRNTLQTNLLSGNIYVQATDNITVDDTITWATAYALSLTAGSTITIADPISGTAGQLMLTAGAGGIANNAGVGTISVSSLKIASSGNVSLTGNNQVGTLAANLTAGAFTFAASGANLNIGTVDGLSGITASGNVSVVSSGGGLSITNTAAADDVSSAGNVTLQAAGTFSSASGSSVKGATVAISTTGGGNISAAGDVTATLAAQAATVPTLTLSIPTATGHAIATTGALTAASGRIDILNSGGGAGATITIGGAVTQQDVAGAIKVDTGGTGGIIQGAGGSITANAIELQSTGSGGPIGTLGTPLQTSSIGAGAVNASIKIGSNSPAGPDSIYLNHAGAATLLAAFTTGAGTPVDISASNNLTAISISTGTSDLKLSAGDLLTVPATQSLTGANITLSANRMDLLADAGDINADAGTLWVKPTTSRNVIIRSNADADPSALELSTAELDTLGGTGTLRIGALVGGNLSLIGPLAPSNFSGVLALESGGTITQATSSDIITASALSIKALENVSLATAPNVVTNLAAQIGDGSHQNRNFSFKNGQALNIGSSIDGISGISINIAGTFDSGAPDGVIALTSGFGLTQSAGALLAGKAVYAEGSRVNLIQANPTGVIAGKATGGASGDPFNYTSSNGIAVTTVNGFAGILVNSGMPDAISSVLTAGAAGISQGGGGTITAPTGLMLSTTGAVTLPGNNDIGSLSALGVSSLAFNDINTLTLGVSGNGVSTTGSGAVNVTAGGQLYLYAPVSAGAGTGNVSLEAPNIQLGVGGGAGTSIQGNIVKLRATTGAISTLASGTSSSTINGSKIGLEADNFSFDATFKPSLTATDSVFYGKVTDNSAISTSTLGGASHNAPTLVVGNHLTAENDTSGAITVDSAIANSYAGTKTLVLLSGAGITQTSAIATDRLAVYAGGAVALDIAAGNTITTLAGTTSSGDFAFKNAAALTVCQISGGDPLVTLTGVSAPAGGVTLTTSAGSITLNQPVAAWNTVILNAAGAITDGNAAANNVSALGLVALAATGIGHGNALETQVSYLEAVNSGANNIEVTNTGALEILSGMSNTGGNIVVDNTGGIATGNNAITAAGGNVVLIAHSPLTIGSGGISAGGSVTLTAGSAGSSTAGDTLTINGPVTAPSGTIILNAHSTSGSNVPTGGNVTSQIYSAPPAAEPLPPAPTVAECTANSALSGCSSVLPSLSACTADSTAAGCTAVLPTLATCTATPTATGCTAVLPTLATCTANPTATGCTAVLPSLATCTTNPTATGCTAVLPSLSTCTTTPTAAGCASVLPTLATCTATPTAAGCTAVLPSLATCTTDPTAAGCTSVLPTLATCTATPTAAGCTTVLPTLASCTATPTAAGCTAVLPSLATCTANPTATGCTAVLPSLASCTATPTAAGCASVLPSVVTCTANPTAAGCTAVLPTLATCTTAPTTSGCTAVLPPLASCTTNSTQEGCAAVLPTLASCSVDATQAGCSTVLPPVAVTTTSVNEVVTVTAALTATSTETTPSATPALPTPTPLPTSGATSLVLLNAHQTIGGTEGTFGGSASTSTASSFSTTTASSGAAASGAGTEADQPAASKPAADTSSDDKSAGAKDKKDDQKEDKKDAVQAKKQEDKPTTKKPPICS